MSDTVETTPETTNEDQAVVTEQSTEVTTEENSAPEWLQSKYVADGKSQEESINEQAKAYNELSSKFGAFTGAPEEYSEVALSDELKELGIEISNDDPMLKAAHEFAKESNMSQDGLNGLVNLYAMQQVAEQKATEEFKAEQMKALGPNASSRVDNISQWANKNLDAESVQGLEQMATSAESVKVIERLISMSRNASVDPSDANNNSGATGEDVRKMQFETDDNGNRRINTDSEFRARYKKLANEVYGTEDHRQVIG